MILTTPSSNINSSIGSWRPGSLADSQFKAPLVSDVGMAVVGFQDGYFVQAPDPPYATPGGAGVILLFVGGVDGPCS